MRADLLALTTDDLVVLGNRGIVKRALAELDSGQFTAEISEENDRVTVRWSDDTVCTIPAGKGLTDSLCTCPATSLCRHLIRSVLAYQRQFLAVPPPAPSPTGTAPPEPTETTTPETGTRSAETELPAPEPWDPGEIPDEELARHLRKTDLTRARAQFAEDHVVELARSAKPSAYFHTLSCTVRFLVPHDLRYTHCECAAPNPCIHVAEAVWAFRLLDRTRDSGTISTRAEPYPVPASLLDDLEAALLELTQTGVAGLPPAQAERFRRLETRCRNENLVWPAEILAELTLQIEAYRGHDARFSPTRVAELAAELCIRADAIRSGTEAVPQLFVRGSAADRVTEVGSARLVGLGCEAVPRRGSVELLTYLQDTASGLVLAVGHEFTDPPEESGTAPADFWQLAARPVLKGVSLAALGAGQLQLKGGKRTPSSRLVPGRAQFSFNPQSFQWENLRSPVLVEDFAELSMRLASAHPASLRPRRLGADLCVLRVAAITAAEYSDSDQTLYALLEDASENSATIALPFSSRAAEGMDLLLPRLLTTPVSVRFVAGHVRLAGGVLQVRPVSVVVEENGARKLLQPWVDRRPPGTETAGAGPVMERPRPASDPITGFAAELLEALGEQWLLGLQRADAATASAWRALERHGAALGFDRLLRPLSRLCEELERKQSTLHWSAAIAAGALLEAGVLTQLTRETTG